MSLQATQDEAMRRRRPNHAERTAQTHAAFLLPHLRPGMALLDMGCGPGTITAGLAAAVAPGMATGIDLDPPPMPPAGVQIIAGDVTDLPHEDGSFDAIYAGALLQHLADPLLALREARRVSRPGAVIGVADADWDGELLYPTNAVLRRSMRVARKLRQGTSPFVGKQLRHLLTEAGFVRVEASARAGHHGTPDETRQFGAFTASLFRYPAAAQRAIAQGWAMAHELEEMAAAWEAWGSHPGAFVARFWCEVVGWVE
ncbi:methyltransferase domain-containing protein [Allorhizocola rhizosphaerae]|uniref:methyltransferase domain-containing protein n=1 Tax=Allorhizocola rhizosphaerae TaxID=1872709 RepID=UPI000E3BF0CF|nr:methyltransferase domain-containing protein [Allorhizocola rhizosphaerae]